MNLTAIEPMLHCSRRHLGLIALCTALPRPAFAGFNFWDSEFTATRAELQAMIASRFPLSQRYAQIVTVVLTDPQLALSAATNRAAIAALVSVASPLLPTGRVRGTLVMSGAVRFDPAVRALRLDRPEVDRLELQGVSGGDALRLQQISSVVAQELLQGQILRTFAPEELRLGLKTYEIGDITVLDDGIKVQLK